MLKIISADSSAAVLNEKFDPLLIVATAAVQVSPPYREANSFLSEPVFANADDGHEVIVHEAELCRDLMAKVKADVVHLDMSLGAIPLEELSPIQFSNLKISGRAKQHLLKILPRLRKVAGEITQKYGVQVLAIGKESIPVRIAELTSGANAILYACDKAIREKQSILLGLPCKCQPKVTENRVHLYSLITAEHDITGYAEDRNGILKKVNINELLNPCARGFRALRITPK
jgi:hypothetical protein